MMPGAAPKWLLWGLPILMGATSCVPPTLARQPETASAPPLAPAKMLKPASSPAEEPPPLRPDTADLFTAPTTTPASPFEDDARSPADWKRSLHCLTAAVYYEARSESEDGQRAVAQVVLNRVRHPAFPDSVCGVVFQGSERRTGCQFTFTCDGSLAHRPEPVAWARARRIAAEALAGEVYAPVGNATHYHTTAVRPVWAHFLTRSIVIGHHIFYRWRGSAGETDSFSQAYSGVEPSPDWNVRQAVATTDGDVERWRGDGGTVTIHRGSAPTAVTRSEEADAFGVRVHVGSMPTVG